MKSKIQDTSVDNKRSFSDVALITIVTAVGAVLRLYQLPGQIIGDDEWHAIKIASQSTYGFIFTHFNAADNSIPLTLIYKLFLDTVGLNELTLHILQAAVGIVTIPVFFYLAAKVIGRNTSIIFSLLLSLSPFLIYYSRFARPYIFVVFLSFVAEMFFFFWLESRKRWYLIPYIIGAISSAYFSQVSFPSLAAPLVFCLLFLLLNPKLGKVCGIELHVTIKEIILVGATLCCGILAWLVPALGSIDQISSKAGKGHIELSTLSGLLEMFNGFGNTFIAAGFVVLAIVGLCSLYRTNKRFFYFIATIILVQFISIIVAAPYRVELPHVFTRYTISCLSFYLMLVSAGFMSLVKAIRTYSVKSAPSEKTATLVILFSLSTVYICWSPLRTIYASTNNFSNHDDFQQNYSSEVYRATVDLNKISRFYRALAHERENISIVEYPYVLWWSGNIYHFYQQIHRKKVSIGFFPPFYLLQPIIDNQRVSLRKFVRIDSREALVRSGATYLVIHKDIAWEALHVRDIFGGGNGMVPNIRTSDNFFEERYGDSSRSMAEFIAGGLTKSLGRACFEDEWISVFRVPESSAGTTVAPSL